MLWEASLNNDVKKHTQKCKTLEDQAILTLHFLMAETANT